jgi:ribokinase
LIISAKSFKIYLIIGLRGRAVFFRSRRSLMPRHVVVIGSSNTDIVIQADRLPRAGETVTGREIRIFPGGKGANQAVACRRLGAKTVFIARIGTDDYGNDQVKNLTEAGLSPEHLIRDDASPSGLALIAVDKKGQNQIIVVSGSNGRLRTQDINSRKEVIQTAGILVLQLEIPLECVNASLRLARRDGVLTLLNPAPFQPLDSRILRLCDFLVPNQTEAELLTGIRIRGLPSARRAAQALLRERVRHVIITMGEKGAYYDGEIYPARKVKAVDTTAAGDAFVGALAVEIAAGREIPDAIRFANLAASIAVTRPGAQTSIPGRAEVMALL